MDDELIIRLLGAIAGIIAATCVGWLLPWIVAMIEEAAVRRSERRRRPGCFGGDTQAPDLNGRYRHVSPPPKPPSSGTFGEEWSSYG